MTDQAKIALCLGGMVFTTILSVLLYAVQPPFFTATAYEIEATPLTLQAISPAEPSAAPAVATDTPEPQARATGEIDMGEFSITYYCPCKACCGKTDGITYTGAHATPNLTVAVDPEVIPLGSTLYIEGLGFRVAQDIGGAIKGNHIDVFMPTHQEALDAGITQNRVYLLTGIGGDQP